MAALNEQFEHMIERSDPAASGSLNAVRITRRTACSVAAGLSVGVLAGLNTSRADAAVMPGIRYVVTDNRYAQSLVFGTVLARRGAERLEVTNGLTRLWREALAPLWEDQRGAVAGITLTETWAGLAEQARSAGRRSIMVGHHVIDGDAGPAVHSLYLNRSNPGMATALDRCGDDWPVAMADFAALHPKDGRLLLKLCHRSSTAAKATASHVLTSWIIA